MAVLQQGGAPLLASSALLIGGAAMLFSSSSALAICNTTGIAPADITLTCTGVTSTTNTLNSGFSVAGTFEGEFSNVTHSYAGKGIVRYAW